MTPEERNNEKLKLTASWLNGLAVAIFSVGVFAPIGQKVFGIIPAAVKPELIYGSVVVCVIMGPIIHWAG